MAKSKNNFYFILGIILLASFSRLIPHYPNFTPVIAIALFGGRFFNDRVLAILLPLLILWSSDLVLNNFIFNYYESFIFFYPGFFWQYLPVICITLIGRYSLKKISVLRLLGVSISSSLIFYVVSNFGVFTSSSIYTKDLSGLILCYTAALPFFYGTLSSTVIYTFSLFGLKKLLDNKIVLFVRKD
tara:strand:- start:187 stop:744 length:558 start_codon:yes stop_codon:yes gene_type:complete